MSSARKKVLIITYYYPPSGGAGVQRTLKFTKYLPRFGWEPVVLTARNADYPVFDETLLTEVPDSVEVHRTRILEPYRLYRRLTGKKHGESTDMATLTSGERSEMKLTERAAELIRASLFVPDARIGWLPFAASAGKRILQRGGFSAIFSSAPPYTTHLIGRRLKRATGLPWVADFRDSWIGWLSTPQWRPFYARYLENRMEAAVLNEADQILTVSEGVREDLLSRHDGVDVAKWNILHNGFDPDDFSDVTPVGRNSRLTLTYVGSMYGHRNPEYLIRAMETMHDDGQMKGLCVRIVGRVDRAVEKRIATSKVADCFEFVPYLPHRQSMAYLLATDVSLLIIDTAPANKGILTGKLFEYIGAGKPILALAPDGEASKLIRHENIGWVVKPDDPENIRQTLLQILETGTASVRDFSSVQNRFSRKIQAGELAEILVRAARKLR